MVKTKPWVKPLLEYTPLVVFFVAFMWLKSRTVSFAGTEYGGMVGATLIFLPVLIGCTLALWALTGRLSAMQLMTLVLVVVFGGLTVWLNDPRFFKMKPTMIYALFAGLLALGLALRRNWLELVLGEALPLTHAGWRVLTIRLVWFFIAMAAANEVLRRGTDPGGFMGLMLTDQTWVNFKTFGLPLATFLFFILNGRLFARHALPRDTD
ncbi:inner membrane-spanning protein YciB [uncultured Paracoccus sp.]|uniref:inner membrane-spanning protein YciB n=1 Tax=uncultured Paracoccus sp. TaxID=189685 RepID=UPI002637326F|nr:inner membrane-spanning protein YciB [uncultured Paracoccus sp.]